jgi:hypothetical protein
MLDDLEPAYKLTSHIDRIVADNEELKATQGRKSLRI